MRPSSAIRILIIASALAAAAFVIDAPATLGAVARAEPGWLAVVALATGASTVAKAVTWRGCLASLPGVGSVLRRHDLLGPFFVGALVNAGTPARAGDVMRVAMARRVVHRRGGTVGVAEAAGSVVAEHLVSTAVWGVLVVRIAPFLPLPPWTRAVAAATGAAAVVLILLAARRGPRGNRTRGRVRGAAADVARAVHLAARGIRGRRALAELTGSAVLHWVGQWAAAWAVLAGCGLARLGPLVAAAVVVAVALAHAVPVTPGGLGSVQAGVALPLMAAGAAAPEAVAAGVILQLIETALHAVAGVLCLLVPRRAGRAVSPAAEPPPVAPPCGPRRGRGPRAARTSAAAVPPR